MQVTVDEAFTAIHQCQMLSFEQGDVVSGDIAVMLLRTGAAVTPADDEAKALASEEPDENAAAVRALLDAGITPVADHVDEADPDDDPVEPGDIDIATSTIDQVLDWVGTSSDRALAAHEIEEGRGDRARSTLLAKLAEIGLD